MFTIRDLGYVSSLIGEFSRCELVGWQFFHTLVQVGIAATLIIVAR